MQIDSTVKLGMCCFFIIPGRYSYGIAPITCRLHVSIFNCSRSKPMFMGLVPSIWPPTVGRGKCMFASK